MPIYAYRCGACGFSKDALQKVSDAPLTQCPSCGKPEFTKQVTAAGFQLKGSGWYVTDFRGGSGTAGASNAKNDAKSDDAKPDSAAAKPDSAPTTPATGTTGGPSD